jgi:hypothetical protein
MTNRHKNMFTLGRYQRNWNWKYLAIPSSGVCGHGHTGHTYTHIYKYNVWNSIPIHTSYNGCKRNPYLLIVSEKLIQPLRKPLQRLLKTRRAIWHSCACSRYLSKGLLFNMSQSYNVYISLVTKPTQMSNSRGIGKRMWSIYLMGFHPPPQLYRRMKLHHLQKGDAGDDNHVYSALDKCERNYCMYLWHEGRSETVLRNKED